MGEVALSRYGWGSGAVNLLAWRFPSIIKFI
jgi:hypothetical protein